MRDLYIDADSLVFANAVVCESRTYGVLKKEGHWVEGSFLNRGDASAKITHADDELFIATKVLPFEVARSNLETQFTNVVEQAKDRFGEVKIHVLLTGSGNFRDRIPSRVTYKHNRISTARPAHLHRLRMWAVENLGAKIIHWHEADDEVGMLMTENPTGIACSIDKDLRQLPGDHMIPKKGFIHISPKSAICRLYQQIIAGDTTDGVPGCYKVGPDGAASKVLAVAREHGDDLKKLQAELWKLTLATYEESLKKFGVACGYTDARAAAIETARFVFLLRKRAKDPSRPAMWEPPA